MSGAVLSFPARMTVTTAWNRYAALRQLEIDNPRLMVDRQHCEQVARAYRDWNALFLGADA